MKYRLNSISYCLLAILPITSNSFTAMTTITRTRCRQYESCLNDSSIYYYDDFADSSASSSCVLECDGKQRDDFIQVSLQNRQKDLSFGIGKRYIVRRRGNVHYVPSHPKDDFNVVSQLEEGQIVTATGPSRGMWIPHDGGGWTLTKFQGGGICLEPIDE